MDTVVSGRWVDVTTNELLQSVKFMSQEVDLVLLLLELILNKLLKLEDLDDNLVYHVIVTLKSKIIVWDVILNIYKRLLENVGEILAQLRVVWGFLSLDVWQQVHSVLLKEVVSENIDVVLVGSRVTFVVTQQRRVEIRLLDFVKSVFVQLSDKRGIVTVFEQSG